MTNGPLPSGTFGAYSFDARNRLSSVGGASYTYNPDNLRVAITGSGAATFVVDPNSGLPRVLSRTKNGTTTYYVYGLGLLYEVTGSSSNQYLFDHIGNTVAMVNDSQAVTDRWTYSSFGVVVAHSGATDTPFQFNGEWGVQTDPNGLCYMRARYYNPRLMRFVNADPSKFGGGEDWYTFASNNPVSRTDPFGLTDSRAPNNAGPSIASQAMGAALDSGGRYAGAVNRAFEFWNWPQNSANWLGSQTASALYDTKSYFGISNNAAYLKWQFGTAQGWGSFLGGALATTVVPNVPQAELPQFTITSIPLPTRIYVIHILSVLDDGTVLGILPDPAKATPPEPAYPVFVEPIDLKPTPGAGGNPPKG